MEHPPGVLFYFSSKGRVKQIHNYAKLAVMNRFAFLLLFFALFEHIYAEPLKLEVAAESALLMNAETGAILFEKNSMDPAFPASTTKLATALYVIKKKKDKISEIATVKSDAIASISPQAKRQSNYRSPPHWLETDGVHIGLKKGEEIPVIELLYAMLIASANDASNVIAQHVSGSVPTFIEELNAFLSSIGCSQTHFVNPHGLHHPAHVTTSYDLALMAKEALKEELFREIVSTVSHVCPQTNLEYQRTFKQTNLLLKKGNYFYPYATGIKTGFTQAAGKALVASAENGERSLIAVVLGERGSERYDDIIRMFNCAFKEPKFCRQFLPEGDQSFNAKVPGAKKGVKVYLEAPLTYTYFASEEERVKVFIDWNIPSLPIHKDQVIGSIRIVNESGEICNHLPLFSSEDVSGTRWHRLICAGKKRVWLLLGFTFGLNGLLLTTVRKRRKSRERRQILTRD